MKIKKLALLSPAVLMLFSSAVLMGAEGNGDKKETPKTSTVVIAMKKEVSPFRPKAPSRQSIDCTYYDGTLSVAFLIPEGECTMTVTDNETGMSLQYIFSTEEAAEIYVGPLDSAYIEFDTENGNSYEGWLN